MTAARKVLKQGASNVRLLVMSQSAAPHLLAYVWSSAGFGQKFVPATAAGGSANQLDISSDGTFVMLSSGATPFFNVYPLTVAGGFGERFAGPSQPPAGSPTSSFRGVFDEDADYILYSQQSSAFTYAYPINKMTESIGARLSAPIDPAAGTPVYVLYSKIYRRYVRVVVGAAGHLYLWNAGNFFTTGAADISGGPSGVTVFSQLVFSPNETALAYAVTGTIGIHARGWAGGFNAAYSAPAVSPGVACDSVAFARTGDAIAVGVAGSPYIHAYAWDQTTGFGTKYDDPADPLPGAASTAGLVFTDEAVFISTATTPYIHAYEWDSVTGFGAKYPDPLVLPTNGGRLVMA